MKIHDLIVTFGILMKSNARFQQQLCMYFMYSKNKFSKPKYFKIL